MVYGRNPPEQVCVCCRGIAISNDKFARTRSSEILLLNFQLTQFVQWTDKLNLHLSFPNTRLLYFVCARFFFLFYVTRFYIYSFRNIVRLRLRYFYDYNNYCFNNVTKTKKRKKNRINSTSVWTPCPSWAYIRRCPCNDDPSGREVF